MNAKPGLGFRGFSLIEMLIGLTMIALCFLSFVAVSGKIEHGRRQNITKTKAQTAAAYLMQEIRGLAWDEYAVNNSTPITKGLGFHINNLANASLIGQDGTETADGVFDDVDDYDGKTFPDGPFSSQVFVYYATVPINGSSISMMPPDGKGAAVGGRSNFKVVIVSTTWQGGSFVLKTVTANGR